MKQEEKYWLHITQQLSSPPEQIFREEDWQELAKRLPPRQRRRLWPLVWLLLIALPLLSVQSERGLKSESSTPGSKMAQNAAAIIADKDDFHSKEASDRLAPNQDLLSDAPADMQKKASPPPQPSRPLRDIASHHATNKPLNNRNTQLTNVNTSATLDTNDVLSPTAPDHIVGRELQLIATLAPLPGLSIRPDTSNVAVLGVVAQTYPLTAVEKQTLRKRWIAGVYGSVALGQDTMAGFGNRRTLGFALERHIKNHWHIRLRIAHHWFRFQQTFEPDAFNESLFSPDYTPYGLSLVRNEVTAREWSLGLDILHSWSSAHHPWRPYVGAGMDAGFLQRYRQRNWYREATYPVAPDLLIAEKGKHKDVYAQQVHLTAGIGLRLKRAKQIYIEGQYNWAVTDNIYQVPYSFQLSVGLNF